MPLPRLPAEEPTTPFHPALAQALRDTEALFDEGLLTTDEYQTKKKEILERGVWYAESPPEPPVAAPPAEAPAAEEPPPPEPAAEEPVAAPPAEEEPVAEDDAMNVDAPPAEEPPAEELTGEDAMTIDAPPADVAAPRACECGLTPCLCPWATERFYARGNEPF